MAATEPLKPSAHPPADHAGSGAESVARLAQNEEATAAPPRDAVHDLFLSYRWADKPAVDPLLAALRKRGILVWQDTREVEDLASIQRSVATGLAGARALLAWYSTRYNDSRGCQWELTAAYTAAQAEGDPRRRILVVNPESGNAHVRLPELFDQLHLNARGIPGDPAALERLSERIVAALQAVPATPIGELRALTPPRWLPAMGNGSTRFVGRLAEFWKLHGHLQASRAAMLTGTGGKAGNVLVRGAGGIGKSLLAEEYALRFGAAYPAGVFWLRAYGHPDGGRELDVVERERARDAQLIDFATGLGIDASGMNAAQVRGALGHHFERSRGPYLWVVDDLPADAGPDGLAGWQAPHPLGCTLFTTRTRRFGHVATIELPQLDPDEARSLLTRHHSLAHDEEPIADAICAALGYHALAVDVSAALVERRGLGAVLEALRNPDRDALDLASQLDEALPNGHQRSIATTFLESIDGLDPHAGALLLYATVFAAAPIPRQLFIDCLAPQPIFEEGAAPDQVDLAVSRLLASSLADDAGGGAITVHTLVARTIRFAVPSGEVLAAVMRRAVKALRSRLFDVTDFRNHAHLAPYVVHARELCEAPADEDTASLLGLVGRFDYVRGSYPEARLAFEREYAARKRLQGKEHPDTLWSMAGLARTLMALGDLPGARLLQESVLDARKRLLGEEDMQTLRAMRDLAMTLRKQGDQPGARRLLRAMLDSKRDDDPLTSLSLLAETYRAEGRLGRARRLDEFVLKMHQRSSRRQRLLTLERADILTEVLSDEDARLLREAVLQAKKQSQDHEHLETLTSMFKLAQTLVANPKHESHRLAELEMAKDWLKRTHQHVRVLVPNYARNNLALLEMAKDELERAHLRVLASMHALASTSAAEGDWAEVRRIEEAVLKDLTHLLGEEHPRTLISMITLALTLKAQGDASKARQLQATVTSGLRRLLGADHPSTLDAIANLKAMQDEQPTQPPA